MRNLRVLLTGCLIILLSAPVVVAGNGSNGLFDKLDTNKDGVVSREEFTSCPLVRVKDPNGKEHIQHRDLCAKPGLALSIEEKQKMFDKIDVDKSGALTRKKLNKFATPEGFAPIKF